MGAKALLVRCEMVDLGILPFTLSVESIFCLLGNEGVVKTSVLSVQGGG